MKIDVTTTIYQNHIDYRPYTRETIKRTMEFEGVWQAYYKRWYDKNLPKIESALNVPCNVNWKTTNNRRIEKQCSKYIKCVKEEAQKNLSLLEIDMVRLDGIHAGNNVDL